uniref:Uncharacterized protein ycf23 n=1 Tax=Caulacanthus okamurae TaxID=152008 RepID=A0A6H1U8H4_9FLOR|nr:conserved hypothetical plastid protein [Caulacanthus okamurae]QIZ74746.1 conserved hypothetical plastid protein [Caulacanthus okamurae]
MLVMSISRVNLQKKFLSKRIIKVVTGLSNLNINNILNKVKAAEITGATYVDIAANPELVSLMKSVVSVPICVSSINPRDLYQCILAGADIVEIGNFDVFYPKNIILSTKQIIKIVKEITVLLKDTNICVTIPHYLLLEKQKKLAEDLRNIGVNYIQTEGFGTKHNLLNQENSLIFKDINRSSAALSSSYALSSYINLPVISASGINNLSAPIAISYGAYGIAIGSVLNNLSSICEISNYILEIIVSITYHDNYRLSKTNLKKQKLKSLIFNAQVSMH